MRGPSTRLSSRRPAPREAAPIAEGAPAAVEVRHVAMIADGLHALVAAGRHDVVADVGYHLVRAGLRVTTALTGPETVTALRLHRPDLVVVGDPLPGLGGAEVVRRLRLGHAEVASLVLLPPDAGTEARIGAFETGADDCVAWPSDPRELVHRAHAVLRRAAGPRGRSDEVLQVGGVRLDVARAEVTVDGTPVHFTRAEFELLRVLARHPGTVFTRAELTGMALGGAEDSVRRVDRHVHWIRFKLGAYGALIETLPRVGYRIAERAS